MNANDLKNMLIKLRNALAKEGQETSKMFEIYYRFTRGKASVQEMEEANKQFRDLLKTLGLGIFAVLPAAPVTIPLIVKLGEKLGVDVIPDMFKDEKIK